MLKSRLLSGFTAIFLLCSLRAQAADDQPTSEVVPPSDTSGDVSSEALIIDGDKLELHLDRKMRALGNASISRGKQKILGDIIDYDVQNDELHVTGNARIELGNATLTGPELRMQALVNYVTHQLPSTNRPNRT